MDKVRMAFSHGGLTLAVCLYDRLIDAPDEPTHAPVAARLAPATD